MVTIKEIALAVGVSPATVSRVLNYDNSLSISSTKRQAIMETAEALNYLTPRHRNRVASSVSLSTSGLVRIAFVHSMKPAKELADPYYLGVRLGLEHRCQALKFDCAKIHLADAMADPSLLSGTAGLIAVGTHTDAEIAWLRQASRHLVFADTCPQMETFDRVESDLAYAMAHLLDELYELGYRRIGFIGGIERFHGEIRLHGERRCAAYVQWMRQKELEPICHVSRLSFEDGYDLTREMLAAGPLPEIVICANDNMAIGAYRAISERGLSIPRDIGVVGFNDIPAAQFLSPPLTTVKIHAEQIGATAVDLLGELIAGRDYFKRVVVSTDLIWRESCRSPEEVSSPRETVGAVRAEAG